MSHDPTTPLPIGQLAADRPMPAPANFFHLAYRGTEIQLLVGYIDAERLSTARRRHADEGGDTPVIPIEVVGRFALNPESFAWLKMQIEDLEQKFTPGLRRLVERATIEHHQTNQGGRA